MPLQIGYAQATITPPLSPTPFLAGFGQNRQAAGVHDDLYARALTLRWDETQVILVALDLLGLTRPHCLDIETQVKHKTVNTSLIIACTHTHHGPDTIGLWGPDEKSSGINFDYLQWLKQTITQTTIASTDQLAPAYLRSTAVYVRGLIKNARNPDILDEELTCLQFVEPLGERSLATLLIFPCHPEVLWDNNSHITSDYAHALRREVENETGVPCLFLVGALGEC